MYLVTMIALWLDVLYRLFGLGQPVTAFMDIAVLLTLNVVIAICAILYFGGVAIPKFRASFVAAFYAISVLAGTVFWLAKDTTAFFSKFFIVASISGIFIMLYLLAAYLGTRSVDRKLED
jgi:hypothetical protein